MQEQPNSNLVYVPTRNVTGYATYATFANAEDLFGAETEAVSSDVGSKLSAYAEHAAAKGGLNASALEEIFRIQYDLIFNKKVTIGETITASSSGLLLTAWWCLLPFSRGRVHLASIDSYDSPKIDPQYFAADIDMTTQVAIGKQAQSFWHSKPIADITAGNVTADPESDEDWVGYITNTCEYTCTPYTKSYTNRAHSRTKLSPYWHSIDDGQRVGRRGRLGTQGVRDE